jgi:hypothetical protein
MDEYRHYVGYRQDHEHLEHRARRGAAPVRRDPGRHALARRLRSIADRLDG